MNHSKKTKAGFTFIELLLVIGLVIALGVPAASFSARFMRQMAVRDASEGLIMMLQEARAYTSYGKNGSGWGVKLEADRLILFAGGSFAERNPSLDISFSFNQNVGIEGFSEIIFRYPDCRPDQGSSQIGLFWGDAQESFVLNQEGIIE